MLEPLSCVAASEMLVCYITAATFVVDNDTIGLDLLRPSGWGMRRRGSRGQHGLRVFYRGCRDDRRNVGVPIIATLLHSDYKPVVFGLDGQRCALPAGRRLRAPCDYATEDLQGVNVFLPGWSSL